MAYTHKYPYKPLPCSWCFWTDDNDNDDEDDDDDDDWVAKTIVSWEQKLHKGSKWLSFKLIHRQD